MEKALTLSLDKAARRVITNGLNREWRHLQKLLSDISVQIATEKNVEERASLTTKYANYINQQFKIEEIQAVLDTAFE
jgi:hypothetical protein